MGAVDVNTIQEQNKNSDPKEQLKQIKQLVRENLS